jgi:uncharacterized protein (DUF362 family)/NAD-dependent dihydropyrimidine dehydrogenase PreA subunit
MDDMVNNSPRTVAIVRARDYILDDLIAGIELAINLSGGIAPLQAKGRKLLLKPNMLAGSPPENAVTTHPVFFEAAVIVFKRLGFTLYAGDGPAIESTNGAGKRNGLRAVALAHGVEWSDFADAVTLHNPEGKLVRDFTVARVFTEVDAAVTMPKLKTHSQMYYTGAVKNMFGAIHGLGKSRFHVRFPERENFAKMIVDLNALLKPDFALMDGIVAMEGLGPQNGTPVNMGLILASYDALALDTAACRAIGYDPDSIPILHEAYTRGFWITSPDQLQTAGADLSSVTKSDFKKIPIVKDILRAKRVLPGWLFNGIRNRIVPRPAFNKKCILCKRCTEICQAGALSVSEHGGKKHIAIDYDTCIRCYCCHEICPADAIDLTRGFFK